MPFSKPPSNKLYTSPMGSGTFGLESVNSCRVSALKCMNNTTSSAPTAMAWATPVFSVYPPSARATAWASLSCVTSLSGANVKSPFTNFVAALKGSTPSPTSARVARGVRDRPAALSPKRKAGIRPMPPATAEDAVLASSTDSAPTLVSFGNAASTGFFVAAECVGRKRGRLSFTSPPAMLACSTSAALLGVGLGTGPQAV
mmetsp:Transcript_95889/g.293298  ORF Transcript_95889/g.293298 Transcript_95889/m.293298 type:complete len:201 (+) Transcript_95889:451-1053(+)